MELFNKRSIVVILFFFHLQILEAQPTRGFYIERGNSITFVINTIDKIQNGVISLDFARLIAYYDDDDGTLLNSNWKLTVQAPGGALIQGSIAANQIPLNRIEIRATCVDGASQGWVELADFQRDLILNGDELGAAVPMTIDISYRVGVTNSIVGNDSDVYTVDLWFFMLVQ